MAHTLGLDVSGERLRAALVRTAFRRIELIACLEADSLPQLIGMLPVTPQRVVVAIEASELSLRTLELPTAAMRRVMQVLPYEMESLIPFTAQEVIVDYQPVFEQGATSRLLVAAAPRSLLLERLRSLREQGVEAAEMAVAPLALEALSAFIPLLATPETSLLLMVDATRTEICFLVQGRASQARSLSQGAASFATAEGMQAWLAMLRHTLAAYRAADGVMPTQAWLMGDAALLPELPEACREVLGSEVPVQPLPWPGLPEQEPLQWQRHALALALAWRAAARGKHINLLRGDLAPRRMVSQARRYVRRLVVCGALIVSSLLFYSLVKWSQLRQENVALQAQLMAFTDRTFDQPTADAEQAQRLMEESKVNVGPLPQFDVLDVLDALSKEIKPSIQHDTRRLTVEIGSAGEEGSLELQGIIDRIGDRDAIVARLEKHPCFHDLDTGKTSTVPGTERLGYAITAVVHCGKRAKATGSRTRNAAGR